MSVSKKNATTEAATTNPAVSAVPEAGVNDAVEQLEESDQELLNRLLSSVEAQTAAATELLVNAEEAKAQIASRNTVIGFGAGVTTSAIVVGITVLLGKRKAAKEAALFAPETEVE